MRIVILISLLASVLFACEETIDRRFFNDPPAKPVVEGMITNQPGESYVKLSMAVRSPNDVPEKISGAYVAVTDGENTVVFGEAPGEKGLYLPENTRRAVVEKIYGIQIQIGEYSDSAYTYLTAVAPIGEFITYPDASKADYFFLAGSENDDPSMIRYQIDPPGCTGDTSCRYVLYEYKLSSFDVPQIFSPTKETISFPLGSRVIRKKYSLNPGYESYIRAILSETEWRGGLFDVQPGNANGNFGISTLGYFSGCSLLIDTLYIE